MLVQSHFMSNSSDDQIRKALQTPDHIIIDCRSAGEFESGDAYSGAVNIPLASMPSRMAEIGSKDRTIICYCAAGARACRAAEFLMESGFTHVMSTTNAGHLRQISAKLNK
jgi:rhodanese-related sulfurtransferase